MSSHPSRRSDNAAYQQQHDADPRSQPSSSRYPMQPTAAPPPPASESEMVREMYRMLGNLTRSLVPATRKRRDETAEERQARKELKDRLDDEGYDIVEMKEHSSRPTEPQITDMVQRKLSRWAVDGGHGSTVRYANLVARLKSHPQRPRHVTAILDLLEQLAFTAGPSSTLHEPGAAPRRAADPRPTSSRSAHEAVSNKAEAAPADDAFQRSPPSPPASRPDRAELSNTKAAPPPKGHATTPAGDSHPEREASTSAPTAQSLQQDGRLPRKELLERWRARQNAPDIPEEELLRDVVYILQGISGRYVRWEEHHQLPTVEPGEQPGEPEKVLRVVIEEQGRGRIDAPTRHLIHRLAELGRLYRRVSEFLQERTGAPGSGLIMQSLCHFISNELTGYYRLVASLEAQLNRAGTPGVEGGSKTTEASTYVTLKRMGVWTEETALRMRMTSTIIESCRHAHGGAIVSLIHSYTFNGDPFIRKFTSQLLDEVSRPFFHSLSLWIYEGELEDPFDEFFVELNSDPRRPAGGGGGGGDSGDLSGFQGLEADAASLWQNKFVFRKPMLPSFLDESFGRKIFSTGKSLNFIRHSCGDSDWVATRSNLDASAKDLRYTDLSGLERTIDTAFTIASKRLLDIFLDDFKLLDHLRALKDYLMLFRGDFVDLLMQSLGSSLSRPAASLFRHNLTASLETAVRGSNAQFDDPDILKRLDARILEFSEGDTGWDTFTLEYKVDSPVNTVLDTPAMIEYQTIFRTYLDREAHIALVMLGEMIQFVRQMQGFCQLEVIEYSWDDLVKNMARKEGDLDELIESHRRYLNALVNKVLLKGGKRGAHNYLSEELRAQFNTILAFTLAVDDLSHVITGELARHDLENPSTRPPQHASLRGPRSSRPSSAAGLSLPPADPTAISKISQRLREQSATFQDRMQTIVNALERHSNLTVRDLGSRLNFNVHYETSRRESSSRRAAEVRSTGPGGASSVAASSPPPGRPSAQQVGGAASEPTAA
ncbi:related to Spindle pole body component alp6 [Pseudozyma flocculosa]|uniref:Related to Spindle pole body component alp6 n=1 Tax=Pseudozyma flocculosa TaxID=84751 RepID=A0A5C3EWI1_9BASI|nr:related to Spindle pole body component alp6 [Pseudozyma flocculosa]